MDTTETLLKQLKDIHLPPAPGIWPLAPGWYGLLAILIIGLAIFGFLKLKAYRANRYRKQALKELQQLLKANKDIAQTIEDLAILLKRTAIVAYSHEKVASLTGEAWLKFLDKTGNTQQFSQGVGCELITATYQAKPNIKINELVVLCRVWIEQHKIKY